MKEEKKNPIPQKYKGLLRSYYKQLYIYAKRLDNLGRVEKFLETCDIPKLNKEEVESLNSPITTSEIEAVIKKPLAHKSLGLQSFPGKFHQTFKELTHIFLKLFQKEGKLPNFFYETSIILILNPGKNTTKKENYRPICLVNIDAKILNKVLAIQIQQYIKQIICHNQVGFIPGMQG